MDEGRRLRAGAVPGRQERHEIPIPPPRTRLEREPERRRPRPGQTTRRYRIFRTLLIVAGILVVLGFVLDRALDRPLHGFVVKTLNENLVGYHATVRRVDFHLLGLGLDLVDGDVYQDAHPTPAVIHVPRLRLSVHWRDLLALRLVGDALFEGPTIHANLTQLAEENKDQVGIADHGWQQAIEGIYPLKLNELSVTNGKLVYQDASGFRPLHATDVNLTADNIRNVRSKDRTYPSTVHIDGKIFDVGKAVIDGNADFLAEPTPAIKGKMNVERIDLSYFEPVLKPFGVTVKRGELSGSGVLEMGPSISAVDLDSIVLTDTQIDYAQGAQPTPVAKEAGHEVNKVAHESLNNPKQLFRAKQVLLKNGTLGVINEAENPPYRLYFTDTNFEIRNVSSRAEDGPCVATLKGKFMGSGDVDGKATFYPEGKQANFAMKLAVKETELKSLNDLLRAHGNFDVTAGKFSVYSEVRVRDGMINGYVKPLFHDINVYDKEQDKGKNVFRKMYEGIVGGVAKMLENRKNKEVATVTSLNGPVDDPKSSAMQIIANLVKNAFIKSILPGFQAGVRGLDPYKYRDLGKEDAKDRKDEAQDKEKKKEKKVEKKQKKQEKNEKEGLIPKTSPPDSGGASPSSGP
ncbi:MAG TPA: DUF748 domain-containing protein [Candidatus Polarisedimenticolia bacterium]|nr:DUF748 domain-containing protein [Candidatus Polarisedimenticolia bacterium]